MERWHDGCREFPGFLSLLNFCWTWKTRKTRITILSQETSHLHHQLHITSVLAKRMSQVSFMFAVQSHQCVFVCHWQILVTHTERKLRFVHSLYSRWNIWQTLFMRLKVCRDSTRVDILKLLIGTSPLHTLQAFDRSGSSTWGDKISGESGTHISGWMIEVLLDKGAGNASLIRPMQ